MVYDYLSMPNSNEIMTWMSNDKLPKNIGFNYSSMLPNTERGPGGRLNKKDGLTRYGDFHVKDKTS